MGQPCQFEHDAYKRYPEDPTWGLEGNATGCCVGDTARFYSDTGPRHFCLLHAPKDREPEQGGPWPLERREADQATLLERLVAQWAEETAALPEKDRKVLMLPGIRCGNVNFHSQTFPHRIDLTDATFSGKTRFHNTTFSAGAGFHNTTFLGNAWFDDATFSSNAGFCDAWFRNATFSGDAKFDDATFSGNAWFDNTTFSGYATFYNTTFSGYAWFGDATFSDDARFRNITFSGDAWFNDATFSGDAWFNDATFSGDAWFDNAICYKDIDFTRAVFTHHLAIRDARFLGTLRLQDNRFDFPAALHQCRINRLDFRTHSGARLSLNGCRTMNVTDGVVSDAESGEQLLGLLDNGLFNNGTRSERSSGGELTFTNQHCETLTFQNMDLSRANFAGADVSKTRFISCRWNPPKKSVSKKVRRYPQLWGHPTNGAVKQGQAKATDLLLYKNTYEQLKTNLEEHRDYVQAGAFHYWEMDLRQRLLRIGGLWPPGRLLEWGLFGFYRLISDYGESYIKLFVTTCATLILATGLIGNAEGTINGGFDGCGWLHTFQYTMFSLIPSGFQKAAASKLLIEPLSRWTALGEGVFLLILVPMFIMAIRRRFRR